jgi:hypothetical protein
MAAEISYFARGNHRSLGVPFGIRQSDRLSHVYVIGKTGVGKSTLIETLVLQDISAGRGFALLDPHGDLADRVWAATPEARRADIRYFNAPDHTQPYGYNPLRRVREDKIPLAASGMLETLKKLWPDAWGVRMEHVLRNTLYALLERDGSTIPDILRLYRDEKWRKQLVRGIKNETVRTFWRHEFEKYHYRQKADAVAPIQNKIGSLLADPMLCRTLVSAKENLKFRSIMDQGGGLIVNLAKGHLGEDSSHLLGGLLVSTLGLAAFSRADSAERRPFHLYIDEFQSFATLMLVNMMSELRKFGIGIVVANQHLHQLDPGIRSAVLGNAGSLVSFRVGAEDATYLAREFLPKFGAEDLINLPNHNIYLKLMIAGTPCRPFSATILTPHAALSAAKPEASISRRWR